MYYSTWRHLKELVVVPYQKRSNVKSTVFKSKAGTTTILISSMEDGKTKKKTSKQSKGSVQTESGQSSDTGRGSTVNSERQAKLTTQFHKPDETKTSPSKTMTNQKKVIFEEVSYAREVEDYLMNEVYFTQSKVPRDTRPSSIKYSVGQLVRHKTAEYVGVIIGWDDMAKVWSVENDEKQYIIPPLTERPKLTLYSLSYFPYIQSIYSLAKRTK